MIQTEFTEEKMLETFNVEKCHVHRRNDVRRCRGLNFEFTEVGSQTG